jgi:hypothetical protein
LTEFSEAFCSDDTKSVTGIAGNVVVAVEVRLSEVWIVAKIVGGEAMCVDVRVNGFALAVANRTYRIDRLWF